MTSVNVHLGCRSIRAANDSGKRNLKKVPLKYIVIHSTESPNRKNSAQNVAHFFQQPDTQASVQLVMDDRECIRCLPDDIIPWGAPPLNTRGLHIEQCGFAAWSRAEWYEHLATINRAAKAAAYWAKAYHIPVTFLSPAMLKANKPGITSHRNVSLAFGLSDHTDPGPEGNKHYPYDHFMAKTKEIYNGL